MREAAGVPRAIPESAATLVLPHARGMRAAYERRDIGVSHDPVSSFIDLYTNLKGRHVAKDNKRSRRSSEGGKMPSTPYAK